MTDSHNGTPPVNIPQLAERLDQSIEDFKTFMEQRFHDQEELRKAERVADNRLLDERFKTQTTTLDAAFAAAEKARQEALSTAKDDTARTDSRIKAIEDHQAAGGSRSAGRADVWGWFAAGFAMLIAFAAFVWR